MFQQSHLTVVRIRTSCLQLLITSVWEYLKALTVHRPNHEVMIAANKVLRALSSHCIQSGDMRTLGTSQQLQHHPASPNTCCFLKLWLRTIVVPKQTTTAELESQLHSGQQPQIPSVTLKQSVSGSGEEKIHLVCGWKKTITSPILLCLSHLLELHLLPPECKGSQFWWCQ